MGVGKRKIPLLITGKITFLSGKNGYHFSQEIVIKFLVA